jgi:hypothetical protein
MRLCDVEGHVDVRLDGVALRVGKVDRQRIAVVERHHPGCAQGHRLVPNGPQGLDGRQGERQLHHGAERGLRRTSASDHQLVVLVRAGTEKDQWRFERAAHPAVRFGQVEDQLVEAHHPLHIGHEDAEM